MFYSNYRLIHMNGRIYDPTLGRFLQADPFIQAPTNSQNYNRYSYVLNNPLSYTDPSGFFFKKLKKFVKKYWKLAVAAVVAYYTFDYTLLQLATTTPAVGGFSVTYATAGAYVGAGAAAGFVGGAIATGSLKGAVAGAFSGTMFAGIGGHYGETWNMSRVGTTTVAGGLSSRANGGKFADGAKLSLAVSLLSYANYSMRKQMVEQSRLNKDNIGKKSGGFYGDGEGIAGTRRVVNPNDPLGGYLECGRPAGGCQGVQINPGDLPSGLGGIPYKPYGIVDRVTESFAGPHDWLSDRVGMYDSMGNGILRTGVSGGLYEAVSWGLIPVAAPFSIAGLIDSTPTIYSSIYSERYKE